MGSDEEMEIDVFRVDKAWLWCVLGGGEVLLHRYLANTYSHLLPLIA